MDTTAVRTSSTISPIMLYWSMVKNMDDKLKLELVAMLIESMRLRPMTDDEDRERGFRNLAGCWAKDNGDDDMEAIIREGREGRRGNRISPSFDE